MLLSIIIVNYNVFDLLCACIASLKNTIKNIDYEIIVIDNNSVEKSTDSIIDIYPDIIYKKLSSNIGFGAANNVAFKIAKGDYFLLVNPDIILMGECVNKLIKYIEHHEDVGVVAPALYRPDGKLDYYNPFFPKTYSILLLQLGLYNSSKKINKEMYEFFDKNIDNGIPFVVEQAMGACLLMRKCIYRDIGGFDEAYFLYQEETDWEFRMNQIGWKVIVLPDAKALHYHHASSKNLSREFISYQWLRSVIIFYIKHLNSLSRTFLRCTMAVTLLMRIFKLSLLGFFTPVKFKVGFKYYFTLLIFNFLPKNKLLVKKHIFKI